MLRIYTIISLSLVLTTSIPFSVFAQTKDQKGDTQDFDYLSELEKEIVGQWTNVSMKVWVRTYNKSDTSFIVDIREDAWDTKMNIRPIVTTIRADGTYVSEFRNSFDSLIYRPEGTWLMDGDTLIMQDHQSVYKYKVFIDGDRAEFRSVVDWDRDGQVDDVYFGIQKKKQKR